MLLLLLGLFAQAGDRTPCQKKFYTFMQPGVYVDVRLDCKKEKVELGDAYRAGRCRMASAALVLPDPFASGPVHLKVGENITMFDLNPDAPNKGKNLGVHDGWMETDVPVTITAGDGKVFEVPLKSRVQAMGDPKIGPLTFDIELEMSEEQLRHLQKAGFGGYSFQVKGERFTHFVKKALSFEDVATCVLDGVDAL